jgi:hypothetical protein
MVQATLRNDACGRINCRNVIHHVPVGDLMNQIPTGGDCFPVVYVDFNAVLK